MDQGEGWSVWLGTWRSSPGGVFRILPGMRASEASVRAYRMRVSDCPTGANGP